MLLTALLQLPVSFLSVLVSIFPTITQLPWGLDDIVVSGIGYIHYMALILPPIGILLQGFMYFIYFKITMMFLKMIPIIGNLFR